MKIVYLHINTWLGTSAIGAQHHYGTLKWRKPEERYDYEEYELRRPMTAKEIVAENKENFIEGCGPLFKKGSTTRGFFGEDAVIKAGKAAAEKLFKGQEYILIKGDSSSCSARPLLHWPKRFDDKAKRINELAEEWERIGGYGYAWSAKDKARDKRAEEIDEEWLTLMREIEPTI